MAFCLYYKCFTGNAEYYTTKKLNSDGYQIVVQLQKYKKIILISLGKNKKMLTFANNAASIITTRKGALAVMPTLEEINA